MSAPVFLVSELPAVTAGGVVVVTGTEGHHAMAVQRLRVGERVDVVDGCGTRVRGVVDPASTSRELQVRVDSVVQESSPHPRIVVVQALPKSDRGERAVELLTEVGVDVIVPWQAENCVTRWTGERGDKAHGKWVSTARESTKQSRRSWIPSIAAVRTTSALITDVREAIEQGATVWVLHESAEEGIPVIGDATDIWLIVGPEGGLTAREVTELTDAGAHVVRLGSAVFRTSSAGVIAAAVVSTLTGRWSDAHARMAR